MSPLLVVMSGILGGPQAAQAVIESAGNRICGRDNLLLPPCEKDVMDRLKSWGFEFPANYCNVRIGYRREGTMEFLVKAPAGWSVKPTDHYLYKSLCDDKGRARCMIMYHYHEGDSWLALIPRFAKSKWRKNWTGEHPEYFSIIDSDNNTVWCGESESERDSVFEKVINGVDLKSAAWDCEFSWPESPYKIPELKGYSLTINYHHRSSGNYADGGTTNFGAENDEEAIKDAKISVKSCSQGYILKGQLRDSKGNILWSFDTTPVRRKAYTNLIDQFYGQYQ
jgi:hypothetical protein